MSHRIHRLDNMIRRPTTVTVLPAEILFYIFVMIPRAADAHMSVPPWSVLLHVCRQWRTLSLVCPGLWTTIPLGNVHWTRLALRLSGSLPIVVSFPEQIKPSHKEPIYTAMRHIGRFRALHVHMLTSGRPKDIFQFENTVLDGLYDALPMQLIEFSFTGYTGSAGDSLFSDSYPASMSRIRYLRLTKCFFLGEFSFFPSTLVTLRFEYSEFASWSLAHVADILRRLPLLKELALIRLPLVAGANGSCPEIPPVPLSCLRTLQVVDEAHVVASYMQILELPVANRPLNLRVTCLGSSSHDMRVPSVQHSYRILLPVLEKYLRSTASDGGLSVKLLGDHISSLVCTATGASDRIVVTIPWSSQPRPDIVASLIPLGALKATLSIDGPMEAAIWSAILEKMSPYLVAIHLRNCALLSYCPLAIGGHTNALPRLEEITFNEKQDMSSGEGGAQFSQVLSLLRNTPADLRFLHGLRLRDEQKAVLAPCSRRVFY